MLTIEDHNRDVTGMTYVYPVISRRAGGVSIGINLKQLYGQTETCALSAASRTSCVTRTP